MISRLAFPISVGLWQKDTTDRNVCARWWRAARMRKWEQLLQLWLARSLTHNLNHHRQSPTWFSIMYIMRCISSPRYYEDKDIVSWGWKFQHIGFSGLWMGTAQWVPAAAAIDAFKPITSKWWLCARPFYLINYWNILGSFSCLFCIEVM